MYKNEKGLKVTSILLIIYGGFDILQFLLMLVLVVAMKLTHTISANGILLVLVALTATFNLIMGCTGLKLLKRTGKEKLLRISGYSLLVIILLELLCNIILATFQIKFVTQAIIHIILVLACLQFASKVVQGQSIWDIQQN